VQAYKPVSGLLFAFPHLAPRPVIAPVTDATSTNTADWACIRRLESGDDYTISTGMEPYGGAYQANLTTWAAMGFQGYPSESAPAVQDEFALRLYAYALRTYGDGFEPWQTASACGL